MNYEHAEAYFRPAAEALFGPEPQPLPPEGQWIENKLDRALGLAIWNDYYQRPSMDDFPLNEDMIQLLKQLVGPHGRTILRAYQIKHGIAHEHVP